MYQTTRRESFGPILEVGWCSSGVGVGGGVCRIVGGCGIMFVMSAK